MKTSSIAALALLLLAPSTLAFANDLASQGNNVIVRETTTDIGLGISDAPAIRDFGHGGELTPTFMGDPLPKSFFSKSRDQALAKGFDYSAMFELQVAMNSLRTERSMATEGDLELVLTNQSPHENPVVVSVLSGKSDAVRNFIVSIPPWGTLITDISELHKDKALILVSSQAFEAQVDSLRVSGVSIPNPIEVQPPRVDLSQPSTNLFPGLYCLERFDLKTIEAENGGTVQAYFHRFHRSGRVRNCPYPNDGDDGTPVYSLEVHYPNYGDIFHQSTGAGTVYCPDPKCKAFRYHTSQVTTGKVLVWTNRDYYWDGFDNVLYFGDTGEARCSPSHPSLCFGPLDHFFLVY